MTTATETHQFADALESVRAVALATGLSYAGGARTACPGFRINQFNFS